MKHCGAGMVVLFSGLLGLSDGRAAVVCVSTANGIQSALTNAVANGQNDTINIVAGTYSLSAALAFDSSEAHSLALIGGWNAGCTINTGDDTIVDGQHLVPLLDLTNSNGSITVANLTFVAGRTEAALEAVVQVVSNTGPIFIDRNTFLGNRSVNGNGALTAYADAGGVHVRGNLVIGNRGALLGNVAVGHGGGESYVTGNTILNNTTDTAGQAGGLTVGSSGHFTVSNNIIWGNAGATGSDFSTAVPHSRFTNDIGLIGSGTVAPDQVVGEQYVDPQFEPCGLLCFVYELSRNSPLVDAGTDAPAGGQPAVDLVGKPRKLGLHVDIGAYENEFIFADGFEP